MTCTLGEVKNRADFIIYWGGNPAECHPRHFTKYTLTQKGKYLPRGRKDRTMVLVDIRETMSAKAADIFLQVRPGKDFEMLSILRGLIKNQPVSVEAVAETGLTLEQLQDLVDRMKKAKFGVLFFGMGLSMTRGKHMNSAAALTLAAEMNAYTKFVAMPMRGHGNVTGADVVLRYTTAFPFGISLTRGYPRFNPGEYSTIDLLGPRRQRCDARVGRRPRRDDAEAGDRTSEAHADYRARPEGHAHEPPRPRPHHDGRDRHQRARHGVSHGRDPAAAAAGAEIAVPDRRRGNAEDSRSGAEEACVVPGTQWRDADGVDCVNPLPCGRGSLESGIDRLSTSRDRKGAVGYRANEDN